MQENKLLYIVGDKIGKRNNTVYLEHTHWDDWFSYATQYFATYIDLVGDKKEIGLVKIAEKDQSERVPKLPDQFEKLGAEFFSLGSSEDYYTNLKDTLPTLRENILIALNDIAYNLDLFNEVKSQSVVQVSLMRGITQTMILGQFHRISKGGARLTNYSFKYILPESYGGKEKNIQFEVKANSKPPTNIHAIIGKNGVGKTHLLKRMLYAVYGSEYNTEYGKYEGIEDFSNVVFVSYSAFDMPIFKGDLPSGREHIPYMFVGLIANNNGIKTLKDQDSLAHEFCDSLFQISTSYKKNLWKDTINELNSDITFSELQISSWIDGENISRNHYTDKNIYKKEFDNIISEKYKKLSSGHKVIILTLTKLVESVEEKSIVILDEPEEHLHPPLVSAFIRALSQLLIYRNGVGIIATHSPIVVQEIPQSCVWMIRRINSKFVAERPKIQTFGENLDELISEIFGFEVLSSGFHKLLNDEALKIKDYELALNMFNGELGKEARSLLKAYVYKYKGENNEDKSARN